MNHLFYSGLFSEHWSTQHETKVSVPIVRYPLTALHWSGPVALLFSYEANFIFME
jgi:hypothetical protein